MKATKQYFPVVQFIMLYKVVLTFEAVDEILKCDHSNESYWAVLSCGAIYYAVQGGSTFESVDEIPKCDHSNESYGAVLCCGAVLCVVWGGYDVWVCLLNPNVLTSEMRPSERYFSVVLFVMLYKMIPSLEFLDEILKYDHSSESYWAVLSCGAVHNAVQQGCPQLFK